MAANMTRAVVAAGMLLLGCTGDGRHSESGASDTASGTRDGGVTSDDGTTSGPATTTATTTTGSTNGTATSSDATGGGTTASGETEADTETTGTPLGDVGSGATVYYVGKIEDVTDFSAATGLDLGKHGYYFPQFGQSSPKSKRRARDNMQFSKPTWQKDWEWKVFETCGGDFCNLFSPDAGLFDVTEGEEGIGVYSESEGDAWAFIQFTGGSGNSGSIVDESAHDNSNNTVNHIRMKSDAPKEFCMSILTDNTAGAHDISGGLAARIGWYPDVDLEAGTASVPDGDLVFNGVPDLYVFRFANMTGDDFIKIRLNGEGTDPGFGGLMFDPCD